MNRTCEILTKIYPMFPDATCELIYHNNYELVCAVMLSAQTTDKAVNKVTPNLFKKYPSPYDLSIAKVSEVKEYIKTIGLSQTKAKNLVALAMILANKFNGEVPSTMEELTILPGVGRKTANVVLSVGFNIPAIAVDTHIKRVSRRLQIVNVEADEVKVEEKLMLEIPKNEWLKAHHALLFFGRYHCKAKNPQCNGCSLYKYCLEKS